VQGLVISLIGKLQIGLYVGKTLMTSKECFMFALT